MSDLLVIEIITVHAILPENRIFPILSAAAVALLKKSQVLLTFQFHQRLLQMSVLVLLIFYWAKQNLSFSAAESNHI